MKQLLILSGKGGTGKTTIGSAFIKLADAKAFSDCDVDAPNLHLIMNQTSEPAKQEYYGLPKAKINTDLCIHCDLCRQHCHFRAIEKTDEYKVNYYACEGCGVCELVCPQNAVTLEPAISGELMLYKNGTVFSTAQLNMGSGNSGLLVTEVKKQMLSTPISAELAIIDGSPGIGCPVIASLNGVDMVLIVAEPSVSGISDMKRIIKTAKRFRTKMAICINKYDTNIENAEKIKEFCNEEEIIFVGEIPFDSYAVKAVNAGKSIVDIDCISGNAVKIIFEKTINILFKE